MAEVDYAITAGLYHYPVAEPFLFNGFGAVDDTDASIDDRVLAATSWLHAHRNILNEAYYHGTTRGGYMFLRAVWEYVACGGLNRDPSVLAHALRHSAIHESTYYNAKEYQWFIDHVPSGIRCADGLGELIERWVSRPRGADHLISTVCTLIRVKQSY